jgi:nicotinamidase-related amidase
MKSSHAFLIIDAQYDFCHPQGALYVPGAKEDMQRLKKLITDNSRAISHICVTLDTHPVNDISHPSFWMDVQGRFPTPFTQITSREVASGKWTPRFHVAEATLYLTALEVQGQFHTLSGRNIVWLVQQGLLWMQIFWKLFMAGHLKPERIIRL